MELHVALMPLAFDAADFAGRRVVVVDVLRASTTICAAFAAGIGEVQTHADANACRAQAAHGYLTAGERGGAKLDGFHFGNSPLDLLAAGVGGALQGRKLALTSTNCTQVVAQALPHAREVLIGCHANFSLIVNYLRQKGNLPATLVCAGWQGRVSYEDTLFCGAVVAALQGSRYQPDDAAALALAAYQAYARSTRPLRHLLRHAHHARKLWRMGQAADVVFCQQADTLSHKPRILPLWQDGAFRNLRP